MGSFSTLNSACSLNPLGKDCSKTVETIYRVSVLHFICSAVCLGFFNVILTAPSTTSEQSNVAQYYAIQYGLTLITFLLKQASTTEAGGRLTSPINGDTISAVIRKSVSERKRILAFIVLNVIGEGYFNHGFYQQAIDPYLSLTISGTCMCASLAFAHLFGLFFPRIRSEKWFKNIGAIYVALCWTCFMMWIRQEFLYLINRLNLLLAASTFGAFVILSAKTAIARSESISSWMVSYLLARTVGQFLVSMFCGSWTNILHQLESMMQGPTDAAILTMVGACLIGQVITDQWLFINLNMTTYCSVTSTKTALSMLLCFLIIDGGRPYFLTPLNMMAGAFHLAVDWTCFQRIRRMSSNAFEELRN